MSAWEAATPVNNTTPRVAHPYEVHLPLYQGPLDLLLQLIEQEELDITKVALAQVTDQYLQHLNDLGEVDAETLTDFLVIAAKLLMVKSQVLLPRPPASLAEEEEEDVGDQLARQLVVYKQFKRISQLLAELEAGHLRSFVPVGTAPPIEPRLAEGEISIMDLVTAARRALTIRPPDPVVDLVVRPLTVTIGQQIERLREVLRHSPQVMFSELARTCSNRTEVIVTFMAVLELIKQKQVDVRQDELFGDIAVVRASCFEAPPQSVT